MFSASVMFACFLLVLASVATESQAEGTTTFKGTILENGLPLEGAEISVNKGETNITSGSDGTFTFEYTGTAVFTLSLKGYIFQSTDLTCSESTFTVTEPETDGKIIAVKTIQEYKGTVTSGNSVIHGAKVTYSDSDGNTYSCTTADDGTYSISCPPSKYTADVKCNGYENKSLDVSSNDMTIEISPLEVTLTGMVMDYSTNGDPTAFTGVRITVNNGSATSTTTSTANGFEIKFVYSQSSIITFSHNGYKVTVPGFSQILKKQNEGMTYSVDITDAEMTNGKYVISSLENPTIMIKTTIVFEGSVTGISKGTEYRLKDATVQFESDGNKYSTKTDEDGKFTISCPFGEYEMTAECGGFLLYGPKTVDSSSGYLTVTMEAYGGSFIPGMDGAHSMMVLGLMVLVVVMIFAIICYISSKKGIGNIKTDNDLKNDDE